MPAASIRQGSGQGMAASGACRGKHAACPASIRQARPAVVQAVDACRPAIRRQAVAIRRGAWPASGARHAARLPRICRRRASGGRRWPACPPLPSGRRARHPSAGAPGHQAHAVATIRRKPWTLCRPRVHQRAEHPGKACRHQAAGHVLHHACPLPSAERTRWPACPPLPSGRRARPSGRTPWPPSAGAQAVACIMPAASMQRPCGRHAAQGVATMPARLPSGRPWPACAPASISGQAWPPSGRRAWPPSGASRGHHQRGAGGGLHHACRFHATALQRPCGRHAAQGVATMLARLPSGADRGQHARLHPSAGKRWPPSGRRAWPACRALAAACISGQASGQGAPPGGQSSSLSGAGSI